VRDAIALDIEHLNADGDGVARVGRDDIIVPFTIPGERVRVEREGASSLATRINVVTPASSRVTPRCAHFGPCGGCAWQHIAYPEQLRLKAALVERLVRATVRDAPAVRRTLSAHMAVDGTGRDEAPWGYRQKVHFVFASEHRPRDRGRARAALVMGHYARGSRRVVPVHECPVHDERGNALAFQLAASLRTAGVDAAAGATGPGRARPRAAEGVLRSIVVRVALHTRELMTTLVVSDDRDKRLRGATRRAIDESGASTSLHVNLHPKDDRFIFGRETRHITGQARLREEIDGTAFLISPTAFFQTNVRAAALLVGLVRAAIPPEATVLDLYAGAGLFALPLARAGHRVTAVEENRAAVADGVASQRLNRIAEERCRFIAQPVETALRQLPPADAIVLDPPRSGCSTVVLDALSRRAATRLIYVSCNPEALARDLATLTHGGYAIESIQPVDMFPHTAHVETVAVLRHP
jgi:23S rRNA (uracil1939-C5)-methyltransferase